MTYCMSDIHGEIDRFQAMLSLIRFSSADTLWILGDVIDRCDGGVKLLRLLMDTQNMVMLLGNHERMCLDTLGPVNVCGSKRLWLENGGGPTCRELLYDTSSAERNRILNFLQALPDHLDVRAGKRLYHLVHAMPSDNAEERIWGRPEPDAPAYFDDRTAIIGHTPTCYMWGDTGTPFTIWYGNGLIDIDCGCGSKASQRRLACLRLEDMAEFYV